MIKTKERQKIHQWIRLAFMLSALAVMVSCGEEITQKVSKGVEEAGEDVEEAIEDVQKEGEGVKEVSVYANCPVKSVKYLDDAGEEFDSYTFDYTSGKLSSVSISDEEGNEQVRVSYAGDKVVRLQHYLGPDKPEDYDSIVWSGDQLVKIIEKSVSSFSCGEDTLCSEYEIEETRFTYNAKGITKSESYFGSSSDSFEDVTMVLSDRESYEYTGQNVTKITEIDYLPDGSIDDEYLILVTYGEGENPFYQNIVWKIIYGDQPYEYLSANSVSKEVFKNITESREDMEVFTNEYDKEGKLIKASFDEDDTVLYTYTCE